MRVPVLVAGLLLACPVAAGAADVLINNGLDCSNPGNVIDHATYQSDYVYVRNAGCGTPDPGSPCASPGDATEVCVEVGGEVYELSPYDSSAVTINGGTAKWGGIWAGDFSTVTINGGTVAGTVDAHDSSAVTMNGGTVEGGFSPRTSPQSRSTTGRWRIKCWS